MEDKNVFKVIADFYRKTFTYKGECSVFEYVIPLFLMIMIAVFGSISAFALLLFTGANRGLSVAFAVISIVFAAILLISVIPWISLNIRRLQTVGKNKWLTALYLIVGIGAVIVISMCLISYDSKSFNPESNLDFPDVYGPPEEIYMEYETGPEETTEEDSEEEIESLIEKSEEQAEDEDTSADEKSEDIEDEAEIYIGFPGEDADILQPTLMYGPPTDILDNIPIE